VFDWLFEGRLTVYAILVLAVIVVWYAAAGHRHRGLFILTIVVLANLYFLLDILVETKREQVRRKVREMADAVARRDPDTVGRHVAQSFLVQNMNAAGFRDFVKTVLDQRRIDELVVWDFDAQPAEDEQSILVTFQAKPKITGATTPHFFCEATFVLESDGQWRMSGLKVFLVDRSKPLDLPM
jgi:hypothetical protein